MVFRPRSIIPGLSKDATRGIFDVQQSIAKELSDISDKVDGGTTLNSSTDVVAATYQTVRVVLNNQKLILPPVSSVTTSVWVEVLVTSAPSGKSLTVVTTSGNVQGSPSYRILDAGLYTFKCDGLTSWWCSTIGTPSPTAPARTFWGNGSTGAAQPTYYSLLSAIPTAPGLTYFGNGATPAAIPTYYSVPSLAGNALTFNRHGTLAIDLTGSPSNVNISSASGDLNIVDISALKCGGVLSYQSVSESNIDGFTVPPNDGFWFILHVRDATTAACITLTEDNGSTTTSIRTPNARGWRLTKNDSVMMIYSNSRWRTVAANPKLWVTPVDSVTWASQQDNYTRTQRNTAELRVTLTGDQTLTGVVPDDITGNGELLIIENIDSVDTLTIAHDATSTAANRFFCPLSTNFHLGPRQGSIWRYDGTSSRWRCIGSPFSVVVDNSRHIVLDAETDSGIGFRKSHNRVLVYDDFFVTSSGSTAASVFLNTFENQWQLDSSGTSSWAATGSSGKPGILTITTGAVNGNYGILWMCGTDVFHFRDLEEVSANYLVSSTANIQIDFGWISSGTGYCIISYLSGTCTVYTNDGTSTTTSPAISAPTTQHLYKIAYDGTSVTFYQGSTLLATHTTNIPNAVGRFYFQIITKTNATKSVSIDDFSLSSKLLSRDT